MRKFLWSVLLTSPAILVGQFLGANEAIATETGSQISTKQAQLVAQAVPGDNSGLLEQIQRYSREGKKKKNSINQVNSVSQLRDVSPGDWAFEALRNLVERYGCIAGFPNGTYRGNQALTRYEFAAGLNACLGQIERLIAAGGGIDTGDSGTLDRLSQEFEAELATLGTRVDNLEGRTAFLEDNQFSTTTQLQGEVVFSLADEFTDDTGGNNTVFQDRVRLSFVSSFTGKDQLYTRLDAGNATNFNTGAAGDQGVLTHNFDNGNNVEIGWLAYYFPIGDKIQVYLPAAFPLWQDFAPTVSPYFEGFTGATAALSSFAESSPIYKIGLAAGGGIGINYQLTETLMLSGGYFGGNSFDPSDGNGLFNGEYSALGQITWTPNDRLQAAFTYVNAYFPGADNTIFDTGVGTRNAKSPLTGALVTNSFGGQIAFQLSPQIALNGFFGFTDVDQQVGGGDAEILYYGVGVAFPDLLKEGNLAGILFGAEPYVSDCDGAGCIDPNIAAGPPDTADDDTAFHLEGFYKYQLNDNLSITPGVIWIAAPFGEDDRVDVIGVLRTTFTF